MTMDPYSTCPCGSGKKTKWCCAAFHPQIEKALALAGGEQADAGLRLLDKLLAENANPPFVRTTRAQILAIDEQFSEAAAEIEATISDFPDYAWAREVRGDLHMIGGEVGPAIDRYKQAIARFSEQAVDQLSRTWTKLGLAQNDLGRPLAAWAAWRRASRIKPSDTMPLAEINQRIRDNPVLPNPVRHGLALRRPDALDLFNEDRQFKWDEALARESSGCLENLALLFDGLTQDDPSNQAAWYNLALACAWSGDNTRAIDAISRFVDLEDDFETAADAWDLCELLRLGADVVSLSDFVQCSVTYDVAEMQAIMQSLQNTRRIRVIAIKDNPLGMIWLDRAVEESHSPVPLLGGPPQALGWIVPDGDTRLHLSTRTPELLERMRRDLDVHFAGRARPTRMGEMWVPPESHFANIELLHASATPTDSEKTSREMALQSFFEGTWLREPLRALGGVSPIDAAADTRWKRKLEGVVRFRERIAAAQDNHYDFDRLRRILGLAAPKTAAIGEDLSAFSPAELAALDPAALDDDRLVAAFRAATNLDVPRTAVGFAREMVRRPDIANKCDMLVAFRRLIADAITTERFRDAIDHVDAGIAYDAAHYGGGNKTSLEALRARIFLAERRPEAACALFRRLFDQEPDNLDLIASAVEDLLSAGVFETARQFAEHGLKRALAQRDGGFQGQFREYLQASAKR